MELQYGTYSYAKSRHDRMKTVSKLVVASEHD
jgi:hypothetical protein